MKLGKPRPGSRGTMPAEEREKEVRDNPLPRISRGTTWEKFEEDMVAHLEVQGLDEAWDSDNEPSDTEPEFFPEAKSAAELASYVATNPTYRAQVTGFAAATF